VVTDVLRLAAEAGVKQLGLFHLNQDRTDRAMDKIVADCRKRIAVAGHRLKCFGVRCNAKFEL
jgi:ribonuclease BN (tRNA processing enzyme)